MTQTTRPIPQLSILIWALLYGFAIVILRRIIGAAGETDSLLQNSTLGFFLSWTGHFVVGMLCAYFLFHRKRHFQISGAALALFYWFGAWLAYRYEAFFGHLPNFALLRFLNDLETVSASLESHFQPAQIILQVALPFLCLLALVKILSRRKVSHFFSDVEKEPWAKMSQNAVAVPVAIFLAIHLYPPLISTDVFWESRNPLLWILQSRMIEMTSEPNQEKPPAALFASYQNALGHGPAFGDGTSDYPLCRSSRSSQNSEQAKRSIIMVVVENLGTLEVRLQHQGKSVLPNLARIIDDGIFFHNVQTSGIRSSHAFPPIFAGLPAQASNILWQVPIPNVDGFPAALRASGYKTIYRHGAELVMEQKRSFLQLVGFEEIIEPTESDRFSTHGWGYSDADMFQAIRSDIQEFRTNSPDSNYLYAFATLSTHDPFTLPSDWKNVFTHQNGWDRYIESLHYFDRALGQFYDWYLENERDRGTVLVVTGDQVPVLKQMRSQRQLYRRFDVPLIIVGGPPLTLTERDVYAGRLAGHLDIPATLRTVLRMPPGNCDQGINLFLPEEEWPKNRVLYAVGSDFPHQFYYWKGSNQLLIDNISQTVTRIETAQTGVQISASEQDQALVFLDNFLQISQFLNAKNAFSPVLETNVGAQRPPVGPVLNPLIVAAQGSVDNPLKLGVRNQRPAFNRAIESGLKWLYVDVSITADKIPVLLRPAQSSSETESVYQIEKKTLAELRALPGLKDVLSLEAFLEEYSSQVNLVLEVWPQEKYFEEQRKLAQLTSSLIEKYRDTSLSVIIQSFSTDLLDRIGKSKSIETALRYDKYTPPTKHWLEYAARGGFDWITIHHSTASLELVRDAHSMGLKVFITDFPNTDRAALQTLGEPDGIISAQPIEYMNPKEN
jgi:phosphoglycerol transferase MdoB-like AlkP superfamily enzyme/glycerophosphoryl diester phosphodiesterase